MIHLITRAHIVLPSDQARGLPHAHMLLILASPLLSTRHIDKIVSAEVPDPHQHPILHELVQDLMIHTPCDLDDSAGCRADNQACKRHFPKDMARTTAILPNSFPQYRRRGQFHCKVKDRLVSDDWVVPHNATLLLRYRCHVNVEVASHIKCFKYVYKYGKPLPQDVTQSLADYCHQQC